MDEGGRCADGPHQIPVKEFDSDQVNINLGMLSMGCKGPERALMIN
jgi:hypothetical protein